MPPRPISKRDVLLVRESATMLPLVDHCVSLLCGDMWDNERALTHPIYSTYYNYKSRWKGRIRSFAPLLARQKAAFCTVAEIEEHKDSSRSSPPFSSLTTKISR